MSGGAALLLFIALQRLAELALSRANTRRLIAEGAREHGRRHFPLIVGFHLGWLAILAVLAHDAALVPFWTGVFVVLQALRVWVIASLGRRWTTRIIVTDEPPVERGPYRWMRHPNYAVVAAEIAVVPLALGEPVAALLFSVVHAGVIAVRIRSENEALAGIRARRPTA